MGKEILEVRNLIIVFDEIGHFVARLPLYTIIGNFLIHSWNLVDLVILRGNWHLIEFVNFEKQCSYCLAELTISGFRVMFAYNVLSN